MFDLMYESRGVGLAANQVDLPLRLFVANLEADPENGEELVFINPVISRLGSDSEYAAFVRRMFNRHDRSTDTDFAQLYARLQKRYGPKFERDTPTQLGLLGYYLGTTHIKSVQTLSRWDKRRAIVFYDHVIELYPDYRDLNRLVDLLEDSDIQTRGHFAQMAMQKNVFDDPEFLALISRENARFLEHLVWLEKQIPMQTIQSRLREFTSGVRALNNYGPAWALL